MVNKIKGHYDTKRIWIDGELLSPTESLKHVNHSPDGFAWGYGGSGPAQLAFAILLFISDAECAKYAYQDFKWEFVVNWKGDFEAEVDIEEWMSNHYSTSEMAKEANEDRLRNDK